MPDKPKDDFVERTPTPETHFPHQAGVKTDVNAEPKKAEKQDVADRKTAGEWVNPLDDTNNDPRVKEIRAAQEKEMEDYKKNYKKNVAKKSGDA